MDKHVPNDAHDAGWFALLLDKHVPNDAADAGWFAGLLDKHVLNDAHDAGWFAGCWTGGFPLMLMMLAGLGAVGQTCSQ